MAIPDYETVMLPLLETIRDGRDWVHRDVVAAIADRFGLTEEERTQRLPSGQQAIIGNRVGWAKAYLKNAGLVEQPKRGIVRITEEGRALLANGLTQLRAYPRTLACFKAM